MKTFLLVAALGLGVGGCVEIPNVKTLDGAQCVADCHMSGDMGIIHRKRCLKTCELVDRISRKNEEKK